MVVFEKDVISQRQSTNENKTNDGFSAFHRNRLNGTNGRSSLRCKTAFDERFISRLTCFNLFGWLWSLYGTGIRLATRFNSKVGVRKSCHSYVMCTSHIMRRLRVVKAVWVFIFFHELLWSRPDCSFFVTRHKFRCCRKGGTCWSNFGSEFSQWCHDDKKSKFSCFL